MKFESKIKELTESYLSDPRAPDITGFVDQLFHVAAETGSVACDFEGDQGLRFIASPASARAHPSLIVGHAAAKGVLRMICARLGVVCKEHAAIEISPYGGRAEIDYDIWEHRRWSISFTNTAERPGFRIEAL